MTVKWINNSHPKFLSFELYKDEKRKAVVQKTRGARHKWYGWAEGSGHKYGPFKGKAAAMRWAEMSYPS